MAISLAYGLTAHRKARQDCSQLKFVFLLQVSSAEQEISCSSSSSPQSHYELLRELLSGPNLTDDDRIRLLLLYAIRYEADGRSQVRRLLC